MHISVQQDDRIATTSSARSNRDHRVPNRLLPQPRAPEASPGQLRQRLRLRPGDPGPPPAPSTPATAASSRARPASPRPCLVLPRPPELLHPVAATSAPPSPARARQRPPELCPDLLGRAPDGLLLGNLRNSLDLGNIRHPPRPPELLCPIQDAVGARAPGIPFPDTTVPGPAPASTSGTPPLCTAGPHHGLTTSTSTGSSPASPRLGRSDYSSPWA